MARNHQMGRGNKSPAGNDQPGGNHEHEKRLRYLAEVLNCSIEEIEQASKHVGNGRYQIEKYIKKRKGITGRPRS